MAKKTLLELVQDILNELDSDEANSINDSSEAQQVASTVRSCFEELISNRNWPHLKKLLQLEPSGNASRPNYMKIPDNVKELIEIRYNVKKLANDQDEYKKITYLDPEAFLDKINQRDSTAANIITVSDFSGVPLLIQDDVAPAYWTSFDDEYVVFDSYNAALDSTLQNSKVQTIVYAEPVWVHEDDAIPDLPSEAFSLLFEEALSVCSINFKQMKNEKAEQKSQRQNRWLARKAWKAKGGLDYEDYGRKSRK